MNKITRRALSLALALTITLSVAAVSTLQVSAITQNEAVSWACAQADNGAGIDFDGHYGYQCVDFVRQYAKVNWGVSFGGGVDYAYQIFDLAAPSGFTKIAYTSGFVAIPGDIIVWAAAKPVSTITGHIAVVVSVNGAGFRVAQQSDGVASHYANFAGYTSVRGVFRPNGFDAASQLPNTSANIVDGRYTLQSKLGANKYVLPTYDAAKGNNVFLYDGSFDANGNPYGDMQWELTRLSDNTYKIANVWRNQALDVDNASTAVGANVQVYDWNDSKAQHWFIVDCGGSYYKLVAKCSGYVLDVANAVTANGTNIQQHADNGSDAQKFKLIAVPAQPTPTPSPTPTPTPKKTVASIFVANPVDKTTYTLGETLSTAGLKIGLDYSDGSQGYLIDSSISLGFVTFSPMKLDKVGEQVITATYEGKTTTFSVTVNATASSPAPTASPSPTADPNEYKSADGILTATVTSVGVKFDWEWGASQYGYRIYRSEYPGGEGLSISDFPIEGSDFVDVNVEPDTQYYYTIKKVLAEAKFNEETVTLTSESLSEASAELAVETRVIILEPPTSTQSRHFILMTLGSPTMRVDEKQKQIDAQGTSPMLVNNRTLVPIRAIIEEMGGTADWNNDERKVTLTTEAHKLEMWLDSKDIVADGVPKAVDVAPQAINGRTMLPIRFVAENVDCQAEWIGSTRQIIIVFYQ